MAIMNLLKMLSKAQVKTEIDIITKNQHITYCQNKEQQIIMKKYIFFITLICGAFLFVTSCSTNISLLSNINRKDSNNQKKGLWVCTDTITNQIVISRYKNGKLNGRYLSYYSNNGILSEKGFYKNGKKYGLWRTYTNKGFPSSVIRYNRKEQVTDIKSYTNSW